jgi:hypothetical protein
MLDEPRRLTIRGKEMTPQREAQELADQFGYEVVLYDQFGEEVARASPKNDG